MPSVVYTLTIIDSGTYREPKTTTDVFSTLLSANRAAYMFHDERKGKLDEDQESVKGINWDTPYSASFWNEKWMMVYDIKVRRVEVGGPDLCRGQVDEPQWSWNITAGFDEEYNEQLWRNFEDGYQYEDEGYGDEDAKHDAESSEVEIIEPPAKRVKLDAEQPRD